MPYRRGRERSRPVDELLTEARSLVAKGAKELTLLGQTVEAYGLDLPDSPDLASLMGRLSEIDGPTAYSLHDILSTPYDRQHDRAHGTFAEGVRTSEHSGTIRR